jgi:hypothetical protein
MLGSSEHRNESSRSIKFREFIYQLSDSQVLKKECTSASQLITAIIRANIQAKYELEGDRTGRVRSS